MSISPFQPDDRPLQNWQSAQNLQKDDAKKSGPLTLSEALTITAGLAGLIGLLSGVVIRFSLSNSSNARFLSPLQTFPALADWAPELPQETADSHYLPGGTQRDTWEGSSDTLFPSEVDPSRRVDFGDADFGDVGFDDADFDGSSFDAFANRGEDGRSYSDSDPWERLRNGPRLSETGADLSEPDDSAEFEDGYAAPYTEDAYIDDPYAEPYEDPYEERGYEDYFDERNAEPFIDAVD